MVKRFLAAYESGYRDGLRLAFDDVLSGQQQTTMTQQYAIDLRAHPAYQEGFSDGLKDGKTALSEIYAMRQAEYGVTKNVDRSLKGK
jgi:hypothetical protein